MTTIEKSLLPPRAANKLRRLPTPERRQYAQELIGRYEVQRTRVHNAAKSIAKTWEEEQTAHLENVLAELREWAQV